MNELATAIAANAGTSKTPPLTDNVLRRVPTAIVCHAFSFLALADHAALWRTSNDWARVARLAPSSSHAVTFLLPIEPPPADPNIRTSSETTTVDAVGPTRERTLTAVAAMRPKALVVGPRRPPIRVDGDMDDDDADEMNDERAVEHDMYWMSTHDFAYVCCMSSLVSLVCPVRDSVDDGLGAIERLTRLESLTLALKRCAPDLAPLGRLPRLRRLAIRLVREPLQHAWHLGATIRSLTRLETLEVRRICDGCTTDMPSVLSMAADLPLFPAASLTAANLYAPGRYAGPMRDADSADGWRALLRWPLRSLSIAIGLSDERLDQLLTSCPQLERLECLALVGGGGGGGDEVKNQVWYVADLVTTSRLDSPSHLSSAAASLSSAQAPPAVTRHALRHLVVEHAGPAQRVAHCLERLPQLESLSVAAPDGAWLRALSRVVSLPRLATLVLRLGPARQPVDLTCMREWRLPSLTDLAFRVANAFDGYVSLHPLSAFPTLQRLVIEHVASMHCDTRYLPKLPHLERVRFAAPLNYTHDLPPQPLVAAFPTLLAARVDHAQHGLATATVMRREKATDPVVWRLLSRSL